MPVLRGKIGATQSADVYEIVVGDIIIIETGSKIPADAILFESSDLIVDERFYNEKQELLKNKSHIDEEVRRQRPDPFLYSQSLVTQGVGKAVIVAVGDNSSRAGMALIEFYTDEINTPLS